MPPQYQNLNRNYFFSFLFYAPIPLDYLASRISPIFRSAYIFDSGDKLYHRLFEAFSHSRWILGGKGHGLLSLDSSLFILERAPIDWFLLMPFAAYYDFYWGLLVVCKCGLSLSGRGFFLMGFSWSGLARKFLFGGSVLLLIFGLDLTGLIR